MHAECRWVVTGPACCTAASNMTCGSSDSAENITTQVSFGRQRARSAACAAGNRTRGCSPWRHCSPWHSAAAALPQQTRHIELRHDLRVAFPRLFARVAWWVRWPPSGVLGMQLVMDLPVQRYTTCTLQEEPRPAARLSKESGDGAGGSGAAEASTPGQAVGLPLREHGGLPALGRRQRVHPSLLFTDEQSKASGCSWWPEYACYPQHHSRGMPRRAARRVNRDCFLLRSSSATSAYRCLHACTRCAWPA